MLVWCANGNGAALLGHELCQSLGYAVLTLLPAGCCYQLCQEWWHQDPQRHWAILQYTSRWDGKHGCIHGSMNCLLLFIMTSVKKKKNDIHFCLCSQWMWQTWYRSCTACMRRFGGLKHQSLLAAVRETCTVVRCPSADICVTGSHSHKVVISHINEADAVCFIVFPFMYCCKICTASEMVMPSIIDTMLPDYCGMHSLDFYEHVWMWLPQV